MEKMPKPLFDTSKENLQAKRELGEMHGLHDETLHDENESRAGGEKYNLADGKPIDNTDTEGPAVLHGVVDAGPREDALPPLTEEDAAERWLRENDPTYKKAA